MHTKLIERRDGVIEFLFSNYHNIFYIVLILSALSVIISAYITEGMEVPIAIAIIGFYVTISLDIVRVYAETRYPPDVIFDIRDDVASLTSESAYNLKYKIYE